jgi:hypothetical protein
MADDPNYTIRFPGGPDDRAVRALQRHQDAHGQPPRAVLVVECPNHHRLARVVRTAEGPVFIGRFTSVELSRTGPEIDEISRRHGRSLSRPVAVLLDLATDQQGVTVQCRCVREVTIPVGWLRSRMVAGERIARYDPRS